MSQEGVRRKKGTAFVKEWKATEGNALLGRSLWVCPVPEPDTVQNAIEVTCKVIAVDAAVAGADNPVLSKVRCRVSIRPIRCLGGSDHVRP